MIRQLRLTNFRSIREAHVDFAQSGLSVVIGANGSGKSNLIKAIQFLASIARNGLEAAMYDERRMEALLPKAIPLREMRSALCRLSFDFTLWRPKWYPASAPDLLISHDLSLGAASGALTRIAEETLRFAVPLLAQFYESSAEEEPTPDPETLEPPKAFFDSSLAISRGSDGRIQISTSPVFETYSRDYLTWLGLTFAIEHGAELTRAELEAVLSSMGQPPGRQGAQTLQDSLISMRTPGPLGFCSEANTFRAALGGIRRYDLQLTQLRAEQASSPTRMLGVDGGGLPAVVRGLVDPKHDQDSWQRVSTTLQALAPHILGARVSSLKSGKEFIEFIETSVGRRVESWESSDGTLRALAILAAVETHPANGTLLIEEPEQGLHPWAIRILLDHVRDSIARRKLQVILTTHSPQVLDNVQADEVLVATRTEAAGTAFHHLHELIPHSRIDMGDIGRLWVRGLLGGVPKYDDI